MIYILGYMYIAGVPIASMATTDSFSDMMEYIKADPRAAILPLGWPVTMPALWVMAALQYRKDRKSKEGSE